MQEKYWRYMVQIKAWIFYLDLYGEDSYKWEKRRGFWHTTHYHARSHIKALQG